VQPGDKEATNNSAHSQRQFETQTPYAPKKGKPPLTLPKGRMRNAQSSGSPHLRGDVDRQRGEG